MGFAHGAFGLQHDVAMRGQQQLQHQQLRIREVWANNLDEEMSTLRALVERYPFISMVGVCQSSRLVLTASGYRIPRNRRQAHRR
jgi:hypothetical protein